MEADDAFSTRLMAEHGVPEDVRLALRAVSSAYRGWGGAAHVTRPLEDGGELRLRDRTLRVLHRPGHSPSDVVLHDVERRILLGADHLLGHISSNPLLTRPLGQGPGAPRPHALETYLESLGRTAAMQDVDLVLTGHGDPVTDPAGLVAERLRAHERRAERIHGLLADGPRTAHELAHAMWGAVAVTQAFLTLSEVLGHLDLLVRDGRAVEAREDGVVRHAQA
jgi:glyoxylase-like metal-dependent hydrolase (beta-lactamase superfamily II)